MPILTYQDANPMVDGRQSDNAMLIQRGVTRYFRQNDIAIFPEFTLANGRRADLAGISKKGEIFLIEIKSSVEDFRVDQKWPQYLEYCDKFYFASHAGVPEEIFPQNEGFILADQFGAEIIREAPTLKLSAGRRKSITLQFARASANRLDRVIRFAHSAGIETPDNLDTE